MQEVIVYRNPAEAAFWNSMMNGGWVIFLAVICLGFFWAFVYSTSDKLLQKYSKIPSRSRHTPSMWISTVLTSIAAVILHFTYML